MRFLFFADYFTWILNRISLMLIVAYRWCYGKIVGITELIHINTETESVPNFKNQSISVNWEFENVLYYKIYFKSKKRFLLLRNGLMVIEPKTYSNSESEYYLKHNTLVKSSKLLTTKNSLTLHSASIDGEILFIEAIGIKENEILTIPIKLKSELKSKSIEFKSPKFDWSIDLSITEKQIVLNQKSLVLRTHSETTLKSIINKHSNLKSNIKVTTLN
jgi:hypothetical protein